MVNGNLRVNLTKLVFKNDSNYGAPRDGVDHKGLLFESIMYVSYDNWRFAALSSQ